MTILILGLGADVRVERHVVDITGGVLDPAGAARADQGVVGLVCRRAEGIAVVAG
jgi:hypothetical protein